MRKMLVFVEHTLFYLCLFVFPFQVGFHFWPPFSYVNGIRVDYLSPTLFISDVVIAALFIFYWCNQKKIFNNASIVIKNPPLLVLACTIGIGILFSKNPLIGIYGCIKIAEFAFYGYYVAWSPLVVKRLALYILGGGVVIESVLGILQFYYQSSLGGMWYFLGERTFTSETPGVANANLFGTLVLRPYATFPHPNVFAGYLLVVSVIVCMLYKQTKRKNDTLRWLGILFLFPAIGIVVAMSRIVWLLAGVIIFWQAYVYSKKLSFIMLAGLLAVFIQTPLAGRILWVSNGDESIVQRVVLARAALVMYQRFPVFGVGLNNFLPQLPGVIASRYYFLLQPVHNVFLLILSQLGAVGFWCVVVFLRAIAIRLRTTSLVVRPYLYTIFISLFFIGMVDHYLVTLQQGQLLVALAFGLLYNRQLR